MIPANNEVIIRYNMHGVTVETGRRIPINICESCGRADFVEEVLSIEEAIEKGYVIDE